MSEDLHPLNLRLLKALEDATRSSVEQSGYIQRLEREMNALRESVSRDLQGVAGVFDNRLSDLEDEMRTTNAHLDNLVRATDTTNTILQNFLDSLASRQEAELKIAQDEKAFQRELELNNIKVAADDRSYMRKYIDEVWNLFKQPMAYVLAGLAFWLLVKYLDVPLTIASNPITHVP